MTSSFDVTFTLDTICPWTYLAKRRLDVALERFKETEDGKQATFVVKYMPYQLYPNQAPEPQDKQEFYKQTPYASTEDRLKMYSTYMSALGVAVGINFSFKGWVSNTLNAHRLIQNYQEENGPDTADKIINSLYRQYFEEEKSPSSDDTLTTAATEAGIPEREAQKFVQDTNAYLIETKAAIREQTGNGVDSVPSIVIEGKRRDITLVGAKEVEEYEKALHQIVKESK